MFSFLLEFLFLKIFFFVVVLYFLNDLIFYPFFHFDLFDILKTGTNNIYKIFKKVVYKYKK